MFIECLWGTTVFAGSGFRLFQISPRMEKNPPLACRIIDLHGRTDVRPVEQRWRLCRQPNDHNFGSLLMLAVTAGAFLLVTWVATKGLMFFIQESPIR